MEQGKEKVGEKERVRRSPRPFPKHTLRQALEITTAIQDNNAGKPMKRILLASAVKRKPMSSEFKHLLSSSLRYGLTNGAEKSDYIELTPLGQSYAKPKNAIESGTALINAALTPELFKKIYRHYDNNKLPSETFLKNNIEREFGVDNEWVDECVKILIDNGRFTGIIRDVSGSPYVLLDEATPPSTISEAEEIEVTEGPGIQKEEKVEAATDKLNQNNKKIFIAHGNNKTPLDQLKTILDQFSVPYVTAIEEAHKGRPISIKVADLMKSCSSAIFIFTSDEEYCGKSGEVTYKPSDNVVYELGAANVLYGNKIVIFKEEGVEFASNFKDFGYISFEKDKLNAKAMDLFKELIAFGFLKVVPG